MKNYLFIICILCSLSCQTQNKQDYLIDKTKYYEFYSNYWVNMHHFLYQKALNSKKRRSIQVEEQKILQSLTEKEKEIFRECAVFYKGNMLKYDLIFSRNATKIKWFLSNYSQTKLPENHAKYGAIFSVLNKFSQVYKPRFWKLHDSSNKEKWNEHKEFIKDVEIDIVEKLSKLAQNKLPEKKLRVDISAYTNWAGAYSTDSPEFHITLSSTRDNLKGNLWVETVFHESNHYLIDPYNSIIAKTIKSEAKKLNVKVPEKLWHAMLFYFIGTTAEEVFAKRNISHKMYMKTYNTFSSFHTAVEQLDDYIADKEGLKKGIRKTLLKFYELKEKETLLDYQVSNQNNSKEPIKNTIGYDDAVAQWTSVKDTHNWIANTFQYDMERAKLLANNSEAKGKVSIYTPEEFWNIQKGICVDVSRFAYETAKKIDTSLNVNYLKIEFESLRIDDKTFINHWLIAYKKDNKYFFFADSKRPKVMDGPYDSLEDFIEAYETFRGRKINSYKLLDSYRKTKKQKVNKSKKQ